MREYGEGHLHPGRRENSFGLQPLSMSPVLSPVLPSPTPCQALPSQTANRGSFHHSHANPQLNPARRD